MCLQNLRKTLRYGGRKNVPSVEEVTAVSAGRNSKRQLYRLPGGSETVVNTKSTTVVADVIAGMCSLINVNDPLEMEEFSLYCIVEGDAFTMPLAADEYILDVTTELHKNQQVLYATPDSHDGWCDAGKNVEDRGLKKIKYNNKVK